MPVIITKENEWYVGSCPLLEIATQGKTEEEVKENLKDLIEEYMEDPDTKKPDIKTIINASISVTNILVEKKEYGKALSATPA